MDRLISVSEEIETQLANITICPEPCEDGMVLVSPPSGSARRLKCPIVTPYCSYGLRLEGKMDGRLNRIMLNAGLPQRHIGNFHGHFSTEALMWVRKWNFQGFLVLTGPCGVGKSFGAAWAVREYLMDRIPDPLDTQTWNCADIAGRSVMWSSANRMIHDRKLASRACDKALLVLDDLGKEGDAQTRRADVGDIISARYDAKLPTVITTELAFSNIIGAYGLSAVHKLTEDRDSAGCGGMIAACGGKSVYSGEAKGESRGNADDDETFYFEVTGRATKRVNPLSRKMPTDLRRFERG
jgi:DNA replication protein DnaC